ncbi:thiolase family protein [Nocardioides nitrophenolicus]|uniref:thiolase family protein n=1 Tax=Nocardioides nitrophenolicus TaxID=60489 RepID=UPI00195CD495|nr:thiolase family protein [Nocardioides nitrophenolicus]MBM7518822.1 acetyl-CoA acyltransferase [Nocardioides nitrophenolicus]
MSSFVYAAVRTPFGRFNGALAGVRADDLGAAAVSSVLARTPGLDPAAIGDVVWGNANGAGEDNRNVGRMAALLAGLPVSVPATTVNRLCGSSLDAVMVGSRTIETGDADIVLTGGVESMTRAPWVLPKPDRAFPVADVTAVSTALGWRLVNPRMPKEWTVSLGEANEQLQERFGISRERQDEFAARSHQLAHQAWEDGFYDDLVVPVDGVDLTRDEGIRPGSTPASLGGLKPVFRKDGTITAGNASPLSDGASAVLLGSEAAADRIGTTPLARVAGRAAYALEPQAFGYAPVEAANAALARAGISWSDVGAVELNEAFAVQSLACVDAWPIDPEIVNQRGGAIALGHPLGASGGRLVGTLAKVLRETGQRWGVAGICIGVGQGLAVVLENVAAS